MRMLFRLAIQMLLLPSYETELDSLSWWLEATLNFFMLALLPPKEAQVGYINSLSVKSRYDNMQKDEEDRYPSGLEHDSEGKGVA